MDRPEALNALSSGQLRALDGALRDVGDDPAISVIVLCSAVPAAFSVGADLKERRGLTELELAAQRDVFVDTFARLRRVAIPVIAAVDGYALGGGCELALSCDLIVASATATFALPETGLGLIPGCGGTQLLPRRIGAGAAADLIYTGRRIGAEEATRLGLVDRYVDSDTARAAALTLAESIAARSPVSLRSAKRALAAARDRPLESGLAVEDEAWRLAAFSADRAEGIAAFLERRPARWPSWPADPVGAAELGARADGPGSDREGADD